MNQVVIFLLFIIPFCKSEDQLTPAKSLFHSDVLVSSGKNFALGFFSPASSNGSSYLGIWYNNIPVRTYVWVANRDNPITAPTSAALTITNTSDIVLSGSQGGGALWVVKSNLTAGPTATAVLLDTGNFVLRLPNNTYVWQSFNHPTDTILPSMKFVMSYKARVFGQLVAWKGPDDPSSGDFSSSSDPSAPALQLFIWKGTRPYYRTGVLNEASMVASLTNNSSSTVSQSFVYLVDEVYFTLTVSEGLPYVRITLDYNGTLSPMMWSRNTLSWSVVTSAPTGCNMYGSCGPFAYCGFRGAVQTCMCLDGFEPVDGLNSSRGCRREQVLRCGKESHFVILSGVKVPDKFSHVPNRSFDECAAECNRSCSCAAYAYAFLRSVRADTSRCLVWSGELVDTSKSVNYGENLYLRLADSSGPNQSVVYPQKTKKHRSVVNIVLPIKLILTFVALIIILKYRGKRRKREIKERPMLEYLSSSNGIGDEILEFPFVSFEDITIATDNFSDSNQIGRGGFGKVYKGTLKGGKEVAIKRLSEGSRQGIEEFKNEIVLFAKLQHRNLVRLLGCSIHGDERVLIYEYLPNKSLDAFLFDALGKHVLDWSIRFKIIKGVARGLLYLHQDSRLTIIHRDLKASNILLDVEMNPKISDFGLARIFGGNQLNANTTRVAGTYGYMSLEYAIEGSFSVKLNIYSFGVLLLEIVSGLKTNSSQLIMDFFSLATYAWGLWKEGKTRDLVDPSIVESCALDEVLRCIHVGLLCIQDHPDDRPLMSSVIFMLENDTGTLPAPKQPVYFALRKCKVEEARKNTDNSINKMSITALEGR